MTATPAEEPKAKKFKFPTAFTVLAIVLVLVWIASFFVPAGTYTKDPATGSPVPGTYHEIPDCSSSVPAGTLCADTSFTARFKQLWNSTPTR